MKTATCNSCKQEYWLDFKNGGVKLELDKRTPHRCIRIQQQQQQQQQQQPINEREKKIEELARLKIDALNAIAYSIHELAEVFANMKTRNVSKDGN